MNLLFLSHHRRFKTVARPGPLARGLARRGHAVTLVCIADTERTRFRECEDAGVRIVEAPDLLWGRLRSGWDPLSALRRKAWLRGGKFDLVQAFEARPAVIYPALAACRAWGAPLVMDWVDWWGRGGLITELRPRWYQSLFGGLETYYEEHFRTRADRTTVISHALAERSAGLGVPAETIHWIPGGVDADLFAPRDGAPARARWGLAPDDIVAVFTAMDVTNDADFLLASIARARETDRRIKLLMAGHRTAALDALAAKHNLGDGFRHVGLVAHRDLPEFLSVGDIGLQPFTNRISNVGRWPNKVGDFMAMGLPTVTNPVGEMKLLLEREKVGILAEENVDAFANALLRLAENPALRKDMGARARALAIAEFDWSHIVEKFERVYEAALKS
jgi:glycosyltransferase involved in cell wall biosynthesis